MNLESDHKENKERITFFCNCVITVKLGSLNYVAVNLELGVLTEGHDGSRSDSIKKLNKFIGCIY